MTAPTLFRNLMDSFRLCDNYRTNHRTIRTARTHHWAASRSEQWSSACNMLATCRSWSSILFGSLTCNSSSKRSKPISSNNSNSSNQLRSTASALYCRTSSRFKRKWWSDRRIRSSSSSSTSTTWTWPKWTRDSWRYRFTSATPSSTETTASEWPRSSSTCQTLRRRTCFCATSSPGLETAR